jgi:hypothetical protein
MDDRHRELESLPIVVSFGPGDLALEANRLVLEDSLVPIRARTEAGQCSASEQPSNQSREVGSDYLGFENSKAARYEGQNEEWSTREVC